MIGLGIGIVISRSLGFNISSIFASGEQGVQLEPWDLSTMFQDSTGTTPVTALGQPVGLRLDKSKGLAIGPELITNGTFDSSANWTVGTNTTIASGKATATNQLSGKVIEQTGLSLAVGKTYKISLTVSDYSAGSGLLLRIGNNTLNNITTPSGNGTFTYIYTVTSVASQSFSVYVAATTTLSIDNISLKEISGNHAYQITATKRPIYNNFVDFDGIDDAMNIVFPNLGSDVTIARAVPGVGVSILTGQTIGAGTYTFSADDNGLIIVNRALTPAETAGVTAYLNTGV